MARSAAVYLRKGIAPKTERRYEGVWRRYEDLCRRMGEDPLPVTENKAIAHVVTVADEGVQASTVNHHLAGLRQGQIRAGLPAPSWAAMARLGQVRRGIARRAVEKGQVGLVRDPVTPAHMEALRKTWGRQGNRGVVLWAAACTCYFRCLRAGEALAPDYGNFDEAAHLTFKDVTVDVLEKPQIVTLHIKESKTDRLRKGAKVTLGARYMSCEGGTEIHGAEEGRRGRLLQVGRRQATDQESLHQGSEDRTGGMASGVISGHPHRGGHGSSQGRSHRVPDQGHGEVEEPGISRLRAAGERQAFDMAVALAKDEGPSISRD